MSGEGSQGAGKRRRGPVPLPQGGSADVEIYRRDGLLISKAEVLSREENVLISVRARYFTFQKIMMNMPSWIIIFLQICLVS